MKNLKPVIFVQGKRNFYRQNYHAQTIILKALSNGITDTNQLRKMAGLKTAADLHRTLDKLALRKEYHNALSTAGINLVDIVAGIKTLCETAEKDDTRLKAYQTLLKSLGLDKYENVTDDGKNWEEVIMAAVEDKEKKDREDKAHNIEVVDEVSDDYVVNAPVVPEQEQKRRAEDKELADELYE